MNSTENRFSEAKRVTFYSLIIIIGLTFMKIVFGYISNSIALLSDGFHSLSDVLILSIALFAVSMLAKKPSEKFTYGYYKLEDFATLIISIIFLFIAITLLYEVVLRFLNPSPYETNYLLASVIAFISAFISFVISSKQERIAIKYNVTSLLLNAKEMKYDALLSTIVGLSLITSIYLNFPLEELVAVIISIFIIRISIMGIRDSILDLLDAWSQPEILANIRRIVTSFKEIKKVKMVRVRKAGPLIFGDIVIEVQSGMSIDKIHALTDSIELKLKEETPGLSDIIIHVEPERKKEITVCFPVNKVNNKLVISDHFGKAPFIALVLIDKIKGKYEILSIISNPYIKTPKHSGVKLARILGERGVDAVIIRNIGEAAFLSLKAYMIDIYRTKSSNIKNAISDLLSNKLEKLEKPTKE